MDDQELDYLLAQGRLSGAQKEQVLDAVLEATAREKQPVRHFLLDRQRWVWALSGAAVAVLLVPVFLMMRSPTVDDGFQARGGGEVGQASLDVGCPGGCALGDTLLFRVDGSSEPGFLAAFAVSETGQHIWYFPGEAGEMPAVPATKEPLVLNKGVKLGPEHEPGSYRVHLLLTRSKMSRKDLQEAIAAPGSSAIISKTALILEIKP